MKIVEVESLSYDYKINGIKTNTFYINIDNISFYYKSNWDEYCSLISNNKEKDCFVINMADLRIILSPKSSKEFINVMEIFI